MKLLECYGTLRKGKVLHFLLFGRQPVRIQRGHEYYSLSRWNLVILDMVEFICGYTRKVENGSYIYRKFIYDK